MPRQLFSSDKKRPARYFLRTIALIGHKRKRHKASWHKPKNRPAALGGQGVWGDEIPHESLSKTFFKTNQLIFNGKITRIIGSEMLISAEISKFSVATEYAVARVDNWYWVIGASGAGGAC